MPYQLPTIPDFKGQFVRDFPWATPPVVRGVVGAVAAASLNSGGSVSAIAVTTPGSGYKPSQPPEVILYGGGGIQAAASVVLAGGAVASITVNNPGIGYFTAPVVFVTLGGDNTELEKVTDWDIARAFALAIQFNSSQSVFGTQAAYTGGTNLLAAHYLCETIGAGTQGLGGKAEWLTKAKDVGNVKEQFEIPARILNSPYLAKL